MKMRNFKFYRDDEGWFVDLPEYPGVKADLEMVFGADTLLDIMSNNGNLVNVEISETPVDTAHYLKHNADGGDGSGAFYYFNEDLPIVWLCDVMLFVFGYFPKDIYFKVV